ncbi:MAG: hypothetical protein JO316_26290 [Abitibacteriaceae bacterium]|nr:hypothetical protein [Abditibacteriaceae bacterium]
MIKFGNQKKLLFISFVAILGMIHSISVPAQPPAQAPLQQVFTQKARKALMASITKAKELHCPEVGTNFLLWALVSDKEGTPAKILQKMGVPLETIRLQAEAEMAWSHETDREMPADEPKLSEGIKHVLEFAADEAKHRPGDNKDIESEHLLLGLLRYKQDLPFSYTVLRRAGVTLEKARQEFAKQPRE